MSQPKVTAIVVSYNTGHRLKECLYALDADPNVDAVVVVDNGNPEQDAQYIADFCEVRATFTLVAGQGNIGFGAGVNLGASKASTEQFLVINPDAVLRWGSVEQLQETARELAEPLIVGGRIFNLRGVEERGARRKELTLFRAITRVVGWNTWTLENTPAPDGPVPMDLISGAFFLTSKASFELLGGFDEDYFLHVEDIDLCRRCREAGGTVMYEPRAGALHYGSTSDVSSRAVAAHKAMSLKRYFRKFSKGPFERVLVEIFVPFIGFATWLRG